MNSITRNKFGSKKEILISCLILFLFIVCWSLYTPHDINENAIPFAGQVIWEKHVCSENICVQDIKVSFGEGIAQVTHRAKIFFNIGDEVKLIKVIDKRIIPTRYTGSMPHHYEVYNSRDSDLN